MNQPFNQLTDKQAEALAVLAEECGEVVQAVCKILRHGYESHHPDRPEATNRAELEEELGNLLAAMSLLADTDGINQLRVLREADEKYENGRIYLHHAQDV